MVPPAGEGVSLFHLAPSHHSPSPPEGHKPEDEPGQDHGQTIGAFEGAPFLRAPPRPEFEEGTLTRGGTSEAGTEAGTEPVPSTCL